MYTINIVSKSKIMSVSEMIGVKIQNSVCLRSYTHILFLQNPVWFLLCLVTHNNNRQNKNKCNFLSPLATEHCNT